ncbi:Bodo-specific multi-copy gene family, putative [Bodo saltans]|uniref:Bodo-specific multi-copy gene family, putative n=1 Tax=Bodo saltans TaxID=75058 RepID=A0A0S4JTX7_BODSA|nr:Bodo-specific multi-copy gene family, putative [Bodo saltans]|eukprot:CUG92571.1 Bodo-specific multi-copy gene family, putative [Bodo saltans]
MRARALHGCGSTSVHPNFYTRITFPLYRANSTPNYYDPFTWPNYWTAAKIKSVLEGNLVNPHDPPVYETLAMFLQKGFLDEIATLVLAKVRPPPHPPVDLEDYLQQHLDPKADRADMLLAEREPLLKPLNDGLTPKSGSPKREIVFSYSPRGSGKTQFLKWFVFKERAEAMKCGRVIVRCCEVAVRNKSSWMDLVMKDTSGNNAASSATNFTDLGICELIRSHVELVTGCYQHQSQYKDPPTAYATWISETQRCFCIPPDKEGVAPLIILDTCELLAAHNHRSLVHSSKDRTVKTNSKAAPYTLLEAFCRSMPAPYGIALFGCNAKISKHHVFLTQANVTPLGPLLPLSEVGFQAAVSNSWKTEVDKEILTPLFHLAGGLPRLLRLALQPYTSCLARGSFDAFSKIFEAFKTAAKPACFPTDDKWFPHVYTCLLASSTKAKVEGSELIVSNPAWVTSRRKNRKTYDEAVIRSMGSHNPTTKRFMVPPITFVDAAVKQFMSTLATNAAADAPIKPSELHPFLNADVVEHFGRRSHLERGRQFEKPFTYAVYARYLLEYWKNTKKKWISLAKVFEGALKAEQVSVAERYEVNLSAGFKRDVGQRYEDAVENAATYMGGSAHHDAYIWCREKARTGNIVPFPVPLQLRHGASKKVKDLEIQLLRRKPTLKKGVSTRKKTHKKGTKLTKAVTPSSKDKVRLLLSVNEDARDVIKGHEDDILMINADEMSSISWLGLVSPTKKKRKISGHTARVRRKKSQ